MKILNRKTILFAFLAAFCFSANAQSNVADQLAHLLSQYKTYQANFKQSTSYSAQQKPQVSMGNLYMERPGKFRWEVKAPTKQIVIANGQWMWIYDVELQQVTKQKLSLTQSNNPAVLLSGDVSAMIENYKVDTVKIDGVTWYRLKPLSSQSSFLVVRMRFDSKRLTSIWVKNSLDQTSLFKFSNIKLNELLSSSLFDFKPPAGVDVLQ